MPSHALGVKIGASTSVKPRPSKKSRTLWMIVWRTRKMALCRGDAQPEVAVVHRETVEKTSPASFFALSGYSAATRAHDAKRLHAELVGAFELSVLFDEPGHLDARLLLELVRAREHSSSTSPLKTTHCDDAGAVAQLEEVELAARALVVEPAVEGDFFSDVLAQVRNDGVHGPLS